MKCKKLLAVFLSIAMVLTMIPMMSISAFENSETTVAVNKSDVDYSDTNNWLTMEKNPTKSADVFYVYPTCVMEGTVADINSEEMRKSATSTFAAQAGILADDFNAYAPFYRQLSMEYNAKSENIEELIGLLKENVTIDDIYSSLDYYFTNLNKNAERPFILAGHSQGSAIIRIVLEDYMKNHPDYYKQMIAAYALGMGFGSKWQAENTHVKTATGADDTGVLISWNTEGKGASTTNMLIDTDGYNINPLTWTTDETYVSNKKNLGSLQNAMDSSTLVSPGENDAQVDLTRHALICTTKNDYLKGFENVFGDKSLHGGDWGYYLLNIKENAINRRDHFISANSVDYSNTNNWLAMEKNPTKSADVFYVYPTVVNDGTVADINNQKMRSGALSGYKVQAGFLADDFNVYAPFYRQLAGNYEMTTETVGELADLIKSHVTINDVNRALDYYFTNINKNAERPFILAGHSQGSCVLRIILQDYMKEHPQYYKQMIATYALGMGFGSEWLKANPHVKTATGADDTGVLIAWNTEGKGATLKDVLIDTDSFVINPLNWKTDETYAGKDKNLGSLQNPMDVSSFVTPGENDAQIDLTRHALICTTKNSYLAGNEYFFGDKSLHGGDWGYYLSNIKENAINRRDKFVQQENNGWQQTNGKWQYCKAGSFLTGWHNDVPGWEGQWFYFDKTTGYSKSAWANDIPGWEGQWFYFNPNTCVMMKGWVNDGGVRFFYLDDNTGTMKIGWQFLNWSGGANWFYFDNNGSMQTGWLFLNNKWYYLGSNGAMVTGTQTIDGTYYIFNGNGELLGG